MDPGSTCRSRLATQGAYRLIGPAGGQTPPRQPLPLHAVQRIGQLVLKGIFPRDVSGAVAYWV